MSDAKNLTENFNNWNVHKYLSNLPFPYEEKHARQYIAKILRQIKKKAPKDFVIFITVDEVPVGAVGAHKIEMGHKAEMGYWLAEEYWGKGIMSKAVKQFMDIIFKKFKLRRIYSRAYAPNKGSMRVMEKAGMKFEGIESKGAKKRDAKKNKDVFYDAHVYAKTK
jgi:ribosomal-protein-alanine N-acetyltransferase